MQTEDMTNIPADTLVLDSRLTELSRAQAWGEALAVRLSLCERTRYAILLCLEESLANVVLHGYRGRPGSPIVLRSWLEEDVLFVAIEDQAAPFAPAEPGSDPEAPAELESMIPGGYGIGLLRHFAKSLHYERLAGGNRLTMGFSIRA